MLYTSRELIEKAKALADCANTDFLTEVEAEQMLNEAWSECYQTSINRGDNNFVKRMNAGRETELPKDFYSLRAVKSPDGYLYKRRPLNATINEPGYSIINGKLSISGTLPTGVEVTYYPLPKHLTYQYPEKELGLNDPSALVFDNNSRFFVYWKQDKLVIYDTLNEITTEVAVDYQPNSIECSKSTFFTFENGIYEYDYTGNLVSARAASPNEGPVKTASGLVKFGIYNDLSRKLTFEGQEYTLEFEAPLRTLERIVSSTRHFYYIDSAGTLYEYNKEKQEALVIDTNVSTQYLKFKAVDKEDGVLYYKNKPMIFSRGFNRNEEIDEVRQAIDCDYTRFYGFTDNYIIFSDGLNVHIIGNLPDVVMNFPNNAFYLLIAYAMATRLIAKQGGDASILSNQWLQAMQNYYDQAEDAYMPVRITNVYR